MGPRARLAGEVIRQWSARPLIAVIVCEQLLGRVPSQHLLATILLVTPRHALGIRLGVDAGQP